MSIESIIRETLADEWLPTIYKTRLRPQRTRTLHIDIPERENQAEIQYTLLGIELRSGKRRFACPDLATARYMRIFARIGCRDFAIPYDITKVSIAADGLETSWQKTLLLIAEQASVKSSRSRAAARSNLIRAIRTEVNEIGAGAATPAFDRETKQRNS